MEDGVTSVPAPKDDKRHGGGRDQQTGPWSRQDLGVSDDLDCKGYRYGALGIAGYSNQGSVEEKESGDAR